LKYRTVVMSKISVKTNKWITAICFAVSGLLFIGTQCTFSKLSLRVTHSSDVLNWHKLLSSVHCLNFCRKTTMRHWGFKRLEPFQILKFCNEMKHIIWRWWSLLLLLWSPKYILQVFNRWQRNSISSRTVTNTWKGGWKAIHSLVDVLLQFHAADLPKNRLQSRHDALTLLGTSANEVQHQNACQQMYTRQTCTKCR